MNTRQLNAALTALKLHLDQLGTEADLLDLAILNALPGEPRAQARRAAAAKREEIRLAIVRQHDLENQLAALQPPPLPLGVIALPTNIFTGRIPADIAHLYPEDDQDHVAAPLTFAQELERVLQFEGPFEDELDLAAA